MTLLVRDEADIIRQSIEFHLQHGVDFVIVTDNRSVDGTRDILAELCGTGRVRVIDEPGDDYSQHRWVTRMVLLAREEHGADWILNGDADEFWHAPSGSLKTELAEAAPETNRLVCPRRNMVFSHDRDHRGPWYEALVHRVVRPVPMPALVDPLTDELPCPYLYIHLPGKVLCRAQGLRAVHQGNHDATYDPVGRRVGARVRIYHYPIRGYDQFVAKVRNGGAAYSRNRNLPSTTGWHWRRWYKMLLEGDAPRAYREALPSERRLALDLLEGAAVVDVTMVEGLARLSRGRPRRPGGTGSRAPGTGDSGVV